MGSGKWSAAYALRRAKTLLIPKALNGVQRVVCQLPHEPGGKLWQDPSAVSR